MSEQRKRDDLNLLLSMIINPGLSAAGLQQSIMANQGQSGPSTAEALLGAAGTGLGAYFGGPLGAGVGGAAGKALGGLF